MRNMATIRAAILLLTFVLGVASAQDPGNPTISLSISAISGPNVTINGFVSNTTQIDWNWGDGNTNVGWFPESHTYEKAGCYNVTATAYGHSGQSVSANTVACVPLGSGTGAGTTTSKDPEGPYSLGYSGYTTIDSGSNINYTLLPSAGAKTGLSFGVYNSIVTVKITQGSSTLYSGNLTGSKFNIMFEHPGISGSYSYLNFNSSGGSIEMHVENVGSNIAYFAYNIYNTSINSSIAALITYSGQFAINFNPPNGTPTNIGDRIVLVAPNFTGPTSLAIWTGEGGSGWFAQLGFSTITPNFGAGEIAYPFFEVFPGGNSAPGEVDYSYPLVPGHTYAFTMEQLSGDTWGFFVNNTLITGSTPTIQNGTYTFSSAQANSNADSAVETFVDQGGGLPNVTNPVHILKMMQFKENGKWVDQPSLDLGCICAGYRGFSQSPSFYLTIWGVEGNLQNASLGNDSMLFGSTLAPLLDVPAISPQLTMPLYGAYHYKNPDSGSGIFAVNISGGNIILSGVSGQTFVSLVYLNGSGYAKHIISHIINKTTTFPVNFSYPAINIFATKNYTTFQSVYLNLTALTSSRQTTSTVSTTTTVTYHSTTSTSTTVNTSSGSSIQSEPSPSHIPGASSYLVLAVIIIAIAAASAYYLIKRGKRVG